MPKPRIYPLGTRHKLNYWVDRQTHDFVARNIHDTGYKTITAMLNDYFKLQSDRIKRKQEKEQNGQRNEGATQE